MIFQGIAPTFFGELADTLGRRPVYILLFGIYLVANVGLAVQRSYPALLVLRMVQSTGSSGVIALASGVVADIAHAGERGVYMVRLTIHPTPVPVIMADGKRERSISAHCLGRQSARCWGACWHRSWGGGGSSISLRSWRGHTLFRYSYSFQKRAGQ